MLAAAWSDEDMAYSDTQRVNWLHGKVRARAALDATAPEGGER
jgi:hypothetical protein